MDAGEEIILDALLYYSVTVLIVGVSFFLYYLFYNVYQNGYIAGVDAGLAAASAAKHETDGRNKHPGEHNGQ